MTVQANNTSFNCCEDSSKHFPAACLLSGRLINPSLCSYFPQARDILRIIIFSLGMQLLLTTPAKSQSRREPVFELAFADDQTESDSLFFRFRTIHLGYIEMESGKLIVCDAMSLNRTRAFAQELPKGRFPVQLSLARDNGPGEAPAYVRINFSNDSITRWRYASLPGMKDTPSGKFDFSICDSAGGMQLGVFIDSAAYYGMGSKYRIKFPGSALKKVSKRRQIGIVNKGRPSFIAIKSETDPCYGVILGYNMRNEICKVLIDLEALQYPPDMYWGDAKH